MSRTTLLCADRLSVSYPGRSVVSDLSFSIARGTITALVGPNGCGKSTLLKALARLIPISGGAALLDGKEIHRTSSREIARAMAILPQGPVAPESLTVLELVEQGRYPHSGAFRMLRANDRDSIEQALRLTGMTGFAHRAVASLSGGERQRAWIALTLAQETPLILLDEPTTYLDIGHQIEVLDLVARLHATGGVTVVMVLHDLNQAARYADRLVVLQKGAIHSDGPPQDVLTAAMLNTVFGVDATIVEDPVTGRPAFFAGRRHDAVEAGRDGSAQRSNEAVPKKRTGGIDPAVVEI